MWQKRRLIHPRAAKAAKAAKEGGAIVAVAEAAAPAASEAVDMDNNLEAKAIRPTSP